MSHFISLIYVRTVCEEKSNHIVSNRYKVVLPFEGESVSGVQFKWFARKMK